MEFASVLNPFCFIFVLFCILVKFFCICLISQYPHDDVRRAAFGAMGQFCRAQHQAWKDSPTEANHQGEAVFINMLFFLNGKGLLECYCGGKKKVTPGQSTL